MTARIKASFLCAALPTLLALAGCQHTAGREEQPPEPAASHHYSHLFGQRYRTSVDLYLFHFSGFPDYKYLGLNDGISIRRPAGLPVGIDRKNIGHTIGDVHIVDVVPAGSEFTIAAETHEVTELSGIRAKGGYPMGFICRLNYNGKQIDDALAEFIQWAEPAPPRVPNQQIDTSLAERIP